MRKRTIVLAMIVRDEAHCIERCLDSVKDYVNCMLIHDTGSTDGTQDVIEKYFEANKIEGTVTNVPWVDFGTNRSQVLLSARHSASYTLMLDADETLEATSDAFREELRKLDRDIYSMRVKLGDLNFSRHFLFKNALDWKYLDPIHEYAHCDAEFTPGDIVNAQILSHHDGARSKRPEKYLDDAAVLVKYDLLNGTSPRRTFYTAQCYKDGGKLDAAVLYYKKRIDMEDGWWQERYFSFYQIGLLTKDPKALLEAYLLEPKRAEPLLYMGKILMDQQNWVAAALFLGEAVNLETAPEGSLFVEQDVYDWRAEMELYVCRYYQGLYSVALQCNERLLEKVPEHVKEQVRKNIRFCAEALHRQKDYK